MPNAEEFDEFYIASRRRLLLQTLALTDDLAVSRGAVRDAFVAARHHWQKVGKYGDPENWVRTRAWSIAQRRRTARRWHKEKGLDEAQRHVLDALQELTDLDRKIVLLTQVAGLQVAETGRELGETQARVTERLTVLVPALSASLGCAATAIGSRIESLSGLVSAVRMPRPSVIRRSGMRRRRNHAVVGSALVILLVIGAGSLVAHTVRHEKQVAPAELVSTRLLLQLPNVTSLATRQQWRQLSTSDNTRGTGINSLCQATRFADDDGAGTWVRKFASNGRPSYRLVQTVEISMSAKAARAAYATTVGWFAGCSVARLQLLNAYRVTGVGDDAQVLRLRIPAKQERSYLVGVARTGALTVSTLLEATGGRTTSVRSLVRALATSVRLLCASKAAGTCVTQRAVAPVLPPPSGEAPGMLATADLPPIGKVNQPWVGTNPITVRVNTAATTCDRASFVGRGAVRPLTRTFLIPQANLPSRFGLTETIGKFRSETSARSFVRLVKARMRACPGNELGSTVSHVVILLKGWNGSQFAMWRLENQVNAREAKVGFWMGVAQAGAYVAQVNLTPVGRYDVDEQTFRSVLTRARDRLFEVAEK